MPVMHVLSSVLKRFVNTRCARLKSKYKKIYILYQKDGFKELGCFVYNFNSNAMYFEWLEADDVSIHKCADNGNGNRR